ncbi:MAG TPA: BolA/IbaG family iron-sulfur metabolism protein [Pseudomonadales bacterium]
MNAAIAEAIRQRLPDAEVEVEVDGNRALITVISRSFDGLSRVKRQQAVYAAVGPFISDGTLHAVSIRALTPEEA